jgi:hypothetical protein
MFERYPKLDRGNLRTFGSTLGSIPTLLLTSAFVLWCSQSSSAQEISSPRVSEAVAPVTSEPLSLRALSLEAFRPWLEGDPVREREDLEKVQNQSPPSAPIPSGPDLLIRQQSSLGPSGAAPILGANFDGIAATGFVPPDTVGAIGPNHFIQMVNTVFAIYDRGGKRLVGPSLINSLWKGFGGPCETQNAGDPIVRYDRLADRWLIAQFEISQHFQCIAISRGPNPVLDGWFLYAFPTVTSSGTPVSPDYPKIGIWPDGYYMGTQRGFPNAGLDVWVFERDKMLRGQPARQVEFGVGAPSLILLPSDLDGPPPPLGTSNFFGRHVNGALWGGVDRFEIYAFRVNWVNPASSTFTLSASLPVAPFSAQLCGDTFDGNCVGQPGTTEKLETLPAWTMWRLQYRNFGDHESLVTNHTVNADGHDKAGIRWYEFRRPPQGAWSLFQQGTYSPDSSSRWMASAALDNAGNMAVGHSIGSSTVSPGIRIAGRLPTDPLGTLTSDVKVVDGSGSQTTTFQRWGDYSSMELDPIVPCTFWYTTEYYAATSSAGWSTRVASLAMPSCHEATVRLVQLHNDGGIWLYTGVPCSGNSCPGWQALDNNVRGEEIATAGGRIYQLHNEGTIWRYTGVPCSGNSCPGWVMLDNNPLTRHIAAGSDQLYQLHGDGTIWRSTGVACSGNSCPGWEKLDSNPRAISIVSRGSQLYQLHDDGSIWQYTGIPCSANGCPGWLLLDNNPATRALEATADQLFQLHGDGSIWRYTLVPCSNNSCPGWQALDNNPSTVLIRSGESDLFQLHNDGSIWRYTGTPCAGSGCPGWQLLDNNPRAKTIVAAGTRLYQLHGDGDVWLYTGTPCSGASCPGWERLDDNVRTEVIEAGQ